MILSENLEIFKYISPLQTVPHRIWFFHIKHMEILFDFGLRQVSGLLKYWKYLKNLHNIYNKVFNNFIVTWRYIRIIFSKYLVVFLFKMLPKSKGNQKNIVQYNSHAFYNFTMFDSNIQSVWIVIIVIMSSNCNNEFTHYHLFFLTIIRIKHFIQKFRNFEYYSIH